jgi:hypothetical protein
MWGSKEYGPNTGQVKRFIERLRHLSPEEWEQVLDALAVARAAYEPLDWRDIESAHKDKYGDAPWLQAVDKETRLADWVDADHVFHSMAAHAAALALADAEVMTPRQFAIAYAPFAEVIPVESLGPGKAHATKKLPDTLAGRFASRVNTLPLAEWQRVHWLAYAIQEAIGADAIEAAEDAVLDAVHDRPGDVQDLLLAKQALYENQWPLDEFALHEALYRGVGAKFGRSGWSDAMVQRMENLVESVTAAAERAMEALVFRDAITPKQFWTLYAPFAAAIPPESLEVKSLRKS